jgi:hypothetical protein
MTVIFGPLVCVCAILAAPPVAFAQEAVFSGAVTDATGGMLPAPRFERSTKHPVIRLN